MSEPQASTIVGAATGTAGATYPMWDVSVQAIGGAWPYIIQGLGFIVLVLTIMKLWKENRRLDREKQGRER